MKVVAVVFLLVMNICCKFADILTSLAHIVSRCTPAVGCCSNATHQHRHLSLQKWFRFQHVVDQTLRVAAIYMIYCKVC